jgi:parallel beta-helix repeat protein
MPSTGTISPEHRLALPAGFQLEEYRILKVLGQGGFGITYLAEDTRLNHQVAIKELLPKDFATRSADYTIVPLTQSDEPYLAWAKESFIGEARFLVRLNHPNIVRFFRYFELNSTAYLVMEFVPGQNFKDWMQRHRQPGERELKALLLPLLDGLEYVHQQPLLHRDISPENVMINEAGRPMLLDFGSARAALGTNPKTEVVRRGFSPIEQYQRNSPQGPYTDLYALAGIMIQAISGEAPPDAIVRSGARDPYEPVTRRLRGRYSENFLRALDAAFAPLAKDRPQSVQRWRQLLEISSQPPKRRAWTSLFVAGVAVALLIGGALYYFGERDRLAKLPKTLVVPDQYARIQSAIDAAKAGDTVQVKAGVYHEALKFKEGIELLGADRNTTVVNNAAGMKSGDSSDPALSVDHCRTGKVANLTFGHADPDLRKSGSSKADAIYVMDSSITVENCSATSATGNGIAIYGSGSASSIIRNQCNSNKGSGILFSKGAHGKAAQNICEQNKEGGITVSSTGTNAVLTGNQCRANANGIYFLEGGEGTADQNICEKNLYCGIAATGSNAVLTGNQCRANGTDGIWFAYHSEGKAIGNICEKNDKDGIGVDNASPFLGGNQLSENGMYGLRYDSASKPSFGEPNKISGNKAGDISAVTPTPTPKPALPTAGRFLFGPQPFGITPVSTPSPTPTPMPKVAPTPSPLTLPLSLQDDVWIPSPTPTPSQHRLHRRKIPASD